MNGVLEELGDQWRLRFVRELAHPPEKVWRAITERRHLEAWFPHRIVGEWIVGAPLRFESEFGDFDGEVLAYEPPSLVEFRWRPDTIRLEVVPRADGCTLSLTDTIDELGKAARDAAGWHVCLDALELELAGGHPERGAQHSRDRWHEVHPGYVEEFGEAAATIGPPERRAG